MLVFGTRPEAIKMCPLVKELKTRTNLETIVCVTGQHRQVPEQVRPVVVLRGLHFRKAYPQTKPVRVIRGSLSDVAVDLRPGSATWRQWHSVVGTCCGSASAEGYRLADGTPLRLSGKDQNWPALAK